MIKRLEVEMKVAAKDLDFERAAAIRNRIRALKLKGLELTSEG
ncbi:UvrB/UvrC motif-containing protein [Petrachloros mirabilis]